MTLDVAGRVAAIENDFVIVNVGGELPLELLDRAGVSLRRFHGEAPGEHGDDARRHAGAPPPARTGRSGSAAASSASCTRSPAAISRSSPGRDGSTTPRARRVAPVPAPPGPQVGRPLGARRRDRGDGVHALELPVRRAQAMEAARRAREDQGLARFPRVRGLHEPARHRLPRRVPVEQPPRQRDGRCARHRGDHWDHRPLHLRRRAVRRRRARPSSSRICSPGSSGCATISACSSHAAGPRHARSWTASPRRWRPPVRAPLPADATRGARRAAPAFRGSAGGSRTAGASESSRRKSSASRGCAGRSGSTAR